MTKNKMLINSKNRYYRGIISKQSFNIKELSKQIKYQQKEIDDLRCRFEKYMEREEKSYDQVVDLIVDVKKLFDFFESVFGNRTWIGRLLFRHIAKKGQK